MIFRSHLFASVGMALLSPGVLFAADFDLSAAYSPAFLMASSPGLGSAASGRFLGLGLKAGYWSPVGVIEFGSWSGFEFSPYLQDVMVLSLGLRRYWYRIHDFGPQEFWQQSSQRVFEPYWGFGLARIDQQSAFLTQAETIGVITLRAWGPFALAGVEWKLTSGKSKAPSALSGEAGARFQAGKQIPQPTQDWAPYTVYGEVRFKPLIWPESVPPFVFVQISPEIGLRLRF
ncbi:MAG: hypothetical protein RI953_710 [Pseudomonadota bacterium]